MEEGSKKIKTAAGKVLGPILAVFEDGGRGEESKMQAASGS